MFIRAKPAILRRFFFFLGGPKDCDELKTQEQRVILLQHTLWTEIMYYHKNQAQVAIMYQNFVHEQIKTSQSLTDNWSSLSPLVHELPTETNSFS